MTHSLQQLSDRVEIIDALYRFAAGQDLHDAALFASAFSPQATLDFVQPAKRMGVEILVFQGRETIVSTITSSLADLDTTHTVSNPRVEQARDTAQLTALVEALHVSRRDADRHLLLKNIYRASLERSGSQWTLRHVHIHNVWRQGDPRVLFPR